MIFNIDIDKCLFCGTCVGICPSFAVLIKNDRVVFFDDKCRWCKLCEGICPIRAINIIEKKREEK